MADKELIKKAELVLKEFGLTYDTEFEPVVNRKEDDLLKKAYPEFFENEFSIHFTLKRPDGRLGGHTITVDKKTNELMLLITRSDTYDIPKELK